MSIQNMKPFKVKELRKFEAATGRGVKVRFAPEVSVVGLPGSEGHRYRAEVVVVADERGSSRYDLWFYIDRRSDPLARQLAKRLRQTAAECSKLARAVEGIEIQGE
jgi:hypothetical protein